MRKFYPSVRETFWAKHTPEPNSGCWLWTGKRNAQGYGVLSRKQPDGHIKTLRAHVVAYTMFVGEVPEGLELDHLCRNRACVNPDHLEAVTHQENTRRGGIHRRKSLCKRGHSLDDPINARVGKKGERHCRACLRINHMDRRVGR